MNVTFACPACDRAARIEVASDAASLACPHCKQDLLVPQGAIDQGRLTRCLACPSTELYIRKDFPQQFGVGLVAVGILGSCIAWYFHMIYTTFGILFATALADVLLYALIGNALICYRCGATYRHLEGMEGHSAFDLEVHERHRQTAARMKENMVSQ